MNILIILLYILQNYDDFIYNKYDYRNRITEIGEDINFNASTAFNQMNANDVNFSSSNIILSKKIYYDNASPDSLGQTSFSKERFLGVSHIIETAFGSLQLSIHMMIWDELSG